MSNVNIKRVVENIRSGTTVYTPVVEVVVNAIQAIESNNEKNGVITITIERSGQMEMGGSIPSVESFKITDDGIGFNEENRSSFDTLYSDQKINEGGKGFGRFTCLKYFENLKVDSVYLENDEFKRRLFSMGKGNDIIVHEKEPDTDAENTGSIIYLERFKGIQFPDKKLSTIARNLVEKLLPYFITQDYSCPKIVITEKDGSNPIVLNDYVSNELSGVIKEMDVDTNEFVLSGSSGECEFSVRVFKLYSSKGQKSKISLVAHKRSVTETSIHTYIPEFIEEFYDKDGGDSASHDRNYIIKAYVFGGYLDKNVALERGGFEFHKESDLALGISQNDIEREASAIARQAVGDDITARQEKKREKVSSYIEEEAPWHRDVIERVDLSSMSYNPSHEEIEMRLQKEKFDQEAEVTRKIGQLLKDGDINDLKENINELVSQISETSKNDLTHYIALRRQVLDLFSRNLELDPEGKYSSEGTVHDIIFPRRSDSEQAAFEDHNLWIIDERLNFTKFVSSDLPLDGAKSDRPDLMAYNKRVLFRGDNEASNPVTIFEFKKPQRDDFVNPSSDEDPVQQIVRYVNQVREGKFKTPQGRKILVSENTPFYGFVVCDLTSKVEKWLEFEKDYKPMPDKLGWFRWHDNINLYMEVISWDKVLRDAEMRNKIFFHKLGI